MKKPIYAVLALMIIFGTATTAAQADSDWRTLINWQSYQKAEPDQADSDRKFFIYFFSKRCGYCRKLEKESFSDPKIAAYINQNYTPILVNTDMERQLSISAGVSGVPDLRFLTSDNKPIARLPGYVPRDTLFNLLQYIQTDSYKTMALNDFVKKKNGGR